MKTHLFRRMSASDMYRAMTDSAAAVRPSEEPPEVVITIKTMIAGKAEFVFQDYKIHFNHDSRHGCPTGGATVNGIPWPDLNKPFEMGFTPDFSFAKIYDKSGRGAVELTVKQDRFILSVDDSGMGAAPYQISVEMKRQPVAGTPEESSAADGKKNTESVSGKSPVKPGNRGKLAKKKKKR